MVSTGLLPGICRCNDYRNEYENFPIFPHYLSGCVTNTSENIIKTFAKRICNLRTHVSADLPPNQNRNTNIPDLVGVVHFMRSL